MKKKVFDEKLKTLLTTKPLNKMKQQIKDNSTPSALSINGDEKFTGGEWVMERHNNPDYIDIEGASRICCILINKYELEEIGSSVEEAEANAALIATAPQLYHALKDLLELSKKWSDGVMFPTMLNAKEILEKANPQIKPIKL